MALSPELLDILVCPADKAKVELTADRSGLKCTECGRVYPIREDIPVMLIEEATIEGAAELAAAETGAEETAKEDTPHSA
jgi:uncharacterized protein YbaR (Trm112 family)